MDEFINGWINIGSLPWPSPRTTPTTTKVSNAHDDTLGLALLISTPIRAIPSDSKAHRNGIKKPRQHRYPSLKGVCIKHSIIFQQYLTKYTFFIRWTPSSFATSVMPRRVLSRLLLQRRRHKQLVSQWAINKCLMTKGR